jgi:hypothetical protein
LRAPRRTNRAPGDQDYRQQTVDCRFTDVGDNVTGNNMLPKRADKSATLQGDTVSEHEGISYEEAGSG